MMLFHDYYKLYTFVKLLYALRRKAEQSFR